MANLGVFFDELPLLAYWGESELKRSNQQTNNHHPPKPASASALYS